MRKVATALKATSATFYQQRNALQIYSHFSEEISLKIFT